MTVFTKKEIRNMFRFYIDGSKFKNVKLKEIYPDMFEIYYD